ncbi:MAG: arginine--tRNA ligase [Candidatus Omnitrophota bacterium]|nr:arginine--tRNA ligase [Candidatus Omnitrophota bacterium]
MKYDIQDLLIDVIEESLKGLGMSMSVRPAYLDLPGDPRFGDLSTNIALQLSKQVSRPPRDIASDMVAAIKKRLAESPAGVLVEDIRIEGPGFINFYLSPNYFYSEILEIVRTQGEALKSAKGKSLPVLIEFVSANPTGALSVAHARQAAVGDALASILDFMGFKVTREYYLNDEGNQINILGNSVELRMKELAGEKIDFPEDHYQGDYIYDIAKVAKAGLPQGIELRDFAAGFILDVIRKELDDFGVKFDSWYSQKELGKRGLIEDALDYLKKQGFVYTEDGATWFKSTQFGDDKDRVVIKSDGAYTYLAPDIAYHREKYRRGFKWLINFWGPDHHGYINRLKAAVEALGNPKDSLSIIIVQLATIYRDGKQLHMSTRKGQYITLREVLDEVGKDAARFFFMMRRTASHLDFDLDIAKKHSSENPVYYVQYAHARICSILKNSPAASGACDIDLSVLKEKEELALLKKIWQFYSVLDICLATQDPYMLTVYLQALAESFHKFYDLHRVLGTDDKLTRARVTLIEAVKIVIASGLGLLGVSRPESM